MSSPDNKKFNPKEYEYVGPAEIYKRINEEFKGIVVHSSEEILNWIISNNEKSKNIDLIICTFIINLLGELVIADRHSEHVHCANGENVKSAGEIGFYITQDKIQIEFVTNQSTGYCPASESWQEVENSLRKIDDLNIPEGFDPEFVFSYCPNCQTRQIVKEEFYFCPNCENPLLSENEFQSNRKNLTFR